MIIEYHRPQTIDEAVALLQRPEPLTLPMGGGTVLNQPARRGAGAPYAVVDLQALGLDQIQSRGNLLELGAGVRLQALLEAAGPGAAGTPLGLPTGLQQALRLEGSYNLRQTATVAGSLVAATGRSPFATAMLALDAVVRLAPEDGESTISLGDLLPLRSERLRGRLITQISIPLNVRLAYEQVARTPADQPIVCAVVAAWPSGRTRVALGGFGPAPALAFDGSEAEGAEVAARDAYSQAGDEWASAEYRQEIAGVLTRRLVDQLFPK